MERTISTNQLTPGDILLIRQEEDREKPQQAYVVRRIWQKPILLPNSEFVHFKVIGFTLFHTGSLTDREVSVEELQVSLDDKILTPFYPQTVRVVKGLTPKGYHKQNEAIRKAS